jgi:hypothetical protein
MGVTHSLQNRGKSFISSSRKTFIFTISLHQRRLKTPAGTCSNQAELYDVQTAIRRSRRSPKHPEPEPRVPISNRHSAD